jgi:hypothetical protein
MSEADWEAAVRLASGKRLLTQCLFHFRYGGDRPAALDLLWDEGPGRAAGSRANDRGAGGSGGGGSGGSGCSGGGGGRLQACGATAARPDAEGPSDRGGRNGAAPETVPDVMSEMFELLRAAGVEMKEEGEEAQEGEEEGGQEQGSDQEMGDDEEWALRSAACGAEIAAERKAPEGAPVWKPRPLGPAQMRPAAQAVQPTQPPAGRPQRSTAETARRAMLLAQAQAALSLVREVPGAPPASASLTGEAELSRQRRGLQGREGASGRYSGVGGGAGSVAEQGPVLPLGGSMSSARLRPEVAAAIERAMPPRSIVFERHGAAGTGTDQRRESPIVEVRTSERRGVMILALPGVGGLLVLVLLNQLCLPQLFLQTLSLLGHVFFSAPACLSYQHTNCPAFPPPCCLLPR